MTRSINRRTVLAALPALPLAATPAASAPNERTSELEIYMCGFKAGQRRMLEVLARETEALKATPEPIARKLKRLSAEMVEIFDQLAADGGDSEWRLNMGREDATGELSAFVRITGYRGQAGARTEFSELIWDLTG